MWSLRLSVRTLGFHPGKRSSILLGITTQTLPHLAVVGSFFYVPYIRHAGQARSAGAIRYPENK